MNYWKIESTQGQIMGIYEGDEPADALSSMQEDGGIPDEQIGTVDDWHIEHKPYMADLLAACHALADPNDGRSTGTQALAERLDVTEDAVRKWRQGAREPNGPTKQMIHELASQDRKLRARIDEAVRSDLEWLRNEAQDIESWAGTTADEVDPFDMESGVTSERIPWSYLDAAHYDALMAYARKRWRELA